ncbi:hypothetical protein GCM10023238_12230 [Streptomyces heliomycini]
MESMSTERALALVGGLPRDQAEAVLLRVVVGLDGPPPPVSSASGRARYGRPRTGG